MTTPLQGFLEERSKKTSRPLDHASPIPPHQKERLWHR